MSVETGGPAFPSPSRIEHGNPIRGMSLRDYFAAHAPPEPAHWRGDGHHQHTAGCLACLIEWRFAYADAMLQERERA